MLKICKKIQHLAFTDKVKIIKSYVPDKVKIFIENNLIEELKYFQKKYSLKIEILSSSANQFVKCVSSLSQISLFVLTSLYEGLPNVLLEAQYFKKYIISTDCPTGPREILLNGNAGDLIKIGDYKNLGNLINKFFIRKKIILSKIKLGSKYFSRYDYYANCEKYYKFVIENA